MAPACKALPHIYHTCYTGYFTDVILRTTITVTLVLVLPLPLVLAHAARALPITTWTLPVPLVHLVHPLPAGSLRACAPAACSSRYIPRMRSCYYTLLPAVDYTHYVVPTTPHLVRVTVTMEYVQ